MCGLSFSSMWISYVNSWSFSAYQTQTNTDTETLNQSANQPVVHTQQTDRHACRQTDNEIWGLSLVASVSNGRPAPVWNCHPPSASLQPATILTEQPAKVLCFRHILKNSALKIVHFSAFWAKTLGSILSIVLIHHYILLTIYDDGNKSNYYWWVWTKQHERHHKWLKLKKKNNVTQNSHKIHCELQA